MGNPTAVAVTWFNIICHNLSLSPHRYNTAVMIWNPDTNLKGSHTHTHTLTVAKYHVNITELYELVSVLLRHVLFKPFITAPGCSVDHDTTTCKQSLVSAPVVVRDM